MRLKRRNFNGLPCDTVLILSQAVKELAEQHALGRFALPCGQGNSFETLERKTKSTGRSYS